MSVVGELVQWFADPATWSGYAGIPVRVKEHVLLSVTALSLAAPLAVAIGLFIGHTRRAEFVSVTTANLGRAVPSFAILALAFPISLRLGLGLGFWPTVVALFFLAIPPILTNTYVGVKGVDQDAVEAARGMGLTGVQILRSIEIPLAARLIVAGLRTSAVQVVATATLAAVIAGGGLGRYIVDGFAFGVRGTEGRQMVMGGAILVALLALATEVAFGLLEHRVGPRHLRTPRPPGDGAPRRSALMEPDPAAEPS